MLLKMLPGQITENWEFIWSSVESVIEEEYRTEVIKNDILSSLLSDKMQCWIWYGDEKIKAIATTFISCSPTGEKAVFIYTLYGYETMSIMDWRDAFDTLKKWGKSQGCSEINGYTEVENRRFITLVKRLGGRADEVIIRIGVD